MNYTATIEWRRGDAPFLDLGYSRAHRWRFDGGAVVPGSSSPYVVPVPQSDPAAVDPEEAFVASLSSCHMLWFLAIAAMQVFAAVWLERRLVQAALVATLVQAVPHLGFHLLHMGELPTAQLVASRVSLAIPVALAAGLLWWSSRATESSLGPGQPVRGEHRPA